MLIPIDQDIERPVIVIRASPTPVIRSGRLVRYDGQRFRIRVPAHERELQLGDTVVLDFGKEGFSRCRARVVELDGDHFEVLPKETLQRRDRRDHPRVAAELPVEYRVLSELESLPDRREAIVARSHLSVSTDEFCRPDPFVDVSGTGIRFIDASPPPEGRFLLLRVRFNATEPWRGAVVSVVRVEEEVPGEFSVATTFTELGPGTLESLLDFIARRQEQLLGIAWPEMGEGGGGEGEGGGDEGGGDEGGAPQS